MIDRAAANVHTNPPIRLSLNPSTAAWEQIKIVLSDAKFIADYQAADPERLDRIHDELRSHGWNEGDINLLAKFASTNNAQVQQTIQTLLERGDVTIADWLKGFTLHALQRFAKTAYSYLLTSREESTKSWLMERLGSESDHSTREWLSTSLQSGDRRASGQVEHCVKIPPLGYPFITALPFQTSSIALQKRLIFGRFRSNCLLPVYDIGLY